MNNCAQKVIDQLYKITKDNPEFKEIKITEEVSRVLKNKKEGLFQNEVDYRVLFPNFTPPINENNIRDKFRGDLVGFSDGCCSLIEFKIYDGSNIKGKNPWGVFHFFNQDRLKIESAIAANSNKLKGVGSVVFTIRNTNFIVNQDQVNLMVENFSPEPGAGHPSTKNPNYYSVLIAFREYCNNESEYSWEFKLVEKGNAAFLVGSVSLN